MPKIIRDLYLYDVEELSELLGVQDRTLRLYLRQGKLKGRKFAKKWYVSEEALREYFSQDETAKEDQNKKENVENDKRDKTSTTEPGSTEKADREG